jgi:hypothetical protein
VANCSDIMTKKSDEGNVGIFNFVKILRLQEMGKF